MNTDLEVNTDCNHRNTTTSYELEGTSTGGVYDVIDDYEVVADSEVNKMELPHSDDGESFNLNKCAAYESVSTPHGRD